MFLSRTRQHAAQGLLIVTLVTIVGCAVNQLGTVQRTRLSPDVPTVTIDPVITTASTVVSRSTRLPDYLSDVWPKPESTVSLEDYNASLREGPIEVGSTGIGVVFWTDRIATRDKDIDVNWFTRCSLFVDGVSASSEGLAEDGALLIESKDAQGQLLSRTSGPYFRAWFVPLEVGTHTATFRLQRTTGEVLEYSWSFTVVP